MKLIKQILFILIVLLISYFSINNFFAFGFFPIHDNTQVQRVYEMGKSLSSGMFPVRWVEDLGYGYGYPIFNFYAPLAYYFGAFFYLLGFNALLATKIMMVVGILISGISMYLLGQDLFGDIGGVVSAIFYIYAPYHAVDIFVRGDVGEFWAYAFIPLVFYSLLKVFKEKKWNYTILGALSYASIILSHNLTAFMLTPFLILFIIVFYFFRHDRKDIYHFLLIIILGLGLSSFYVIPAIFEAKYTSVLSQVGAGADFRNHFVCLSQFWNSPWGFGGSAPGCTDGLSFRLGKLHILASLSAVVLFFAGFFIEKLKTKVDLTKYKTILCFAFFSIIGVILSIFLMIDLSRPLWEAVPFMGYLQYPWRFLIFTSFFTSLLAGFLIWYIGRILLKIKKEKIALVIAAGILFLLIYTNAKLFVPQRILNSKSQDFTTRDNLVFQTSKTSDEYMPKSFDKPIAKNMIPKTRISNQTVEVLHEESSTGEVHSFIKVDRETNVKINVAFFPAWSGFLDNKKIPLLEGKSGMIAKVSKGEHALDLFFIQTPVEKMGDSITLAFLFILFIGIIFSIKERKNERKN